MRLLDDIINQTNKMASQSLISNVIGPQVKKQIDADIAYAGITHAETGSFPNPFIRTTANKNPKGSTAFGPAQITYTLAQEAADKGWLSRESQVFYKNVMQPKYEMMKKVGINESMKKKGITPEKVAGYNPAYDYGGNAEFNPTQHTQDYVMFAKDIISGLSKRVNNDGNQFISKWRGMEASQDPDYFNRYKQGMNNFMKEHNVR